MKCWCCFLWNQFYEVTKPGGARNASTISYCWWNTMVSFIPLMFDDYLVLALGTDRESTTQRQGVSMDAFFRPKWLCKSETSSSLHVPGWWCYVPSQSGVFMVGSLWQQNLYLMLVRTRVYVCRVHALCHTGFGFWLAWMETGLKIWSLNSNLNWYVPIMASRSGPLCTVPFVQISANMSRVSHQRRRFGAQRQPPKVRIQRLFRRQFFSVIGPMLVKVKCIDDQCWIKNEFWVFPHFS